MIPSKSKALLVTCCNSDTGSVMLNWAGLGLAILFLFVSIFLGS